MSVVIVRLYWQHDLDLVALQMHPEFDMGREMKKAICAYARGQECSIPLPPSMPFRVELDNCATHFRLTPGKDDDVIAVLNGFRSGFKNSAIKAIFRSCLEGLYLDPYYNQETYATKSRNHGKGKPVESTVPPKMMQQAKVSATPPPQSINKVEEEFKAPPINKTQITPEPTPIKEVEEVKEAPIKEVKQTVEEDTMDLSSEDTGLEDGDSFDLFGAIDSMM